MLTRQGEEPFGDFMRNGFHLAWLAIRLTWRASPKLSLAILLLLLVQALLSPAQLFLSGAVVSRAAFDLGLAGVRESIDVVAGALNEPTQTFSKSVLTAAQLRDLPAPGRRIKNLFLLTPATQIEPECGGFSVSGQKGVFTAFNVDGGDYTSSHFCGHVEMTPTFTVEALQELQVLRSTFSAEFGRSTGGVVNLATKSGTNQFRGSSFYLFRNDALTRRDPYNREQINRGNQFGGSIGGPIIADRTFFFSAAEAQYNDKPVDVLFDQLDVLGLRNTVGAQALLAAAPEASLTAVSRLESVVNRVDHRLTDGHNLVGRLDFTRNKITSSVGSFINTNGLGASAFGFANSNNANWSVAWAAHAGVAYTVTNSFKVELAYRYLNMGSAQTAEVLCGSLGCGAGTGPRAFYHLRNIDSHDLKLGVRWMLQPGPV